MMIRNDNRMWRLLFLCAYMTEVLIQYILQGFVLYTVFSEKQFPKEVCTDMENEH